MIGAMHEGHDASVEEEAPVTVDATTEADNVTYIRGKGDIGVVDFTKIRNERMVKEGNSSNAIVFLSDMESTEPGFFWKYTVSEDGRIDKLFWCDGICRYDYQIFGDVLAFDATYGKNKYNCPLIVFSGVNHHNNTVVFASAIVSDESIDTYVWVLENFLEAMGGKAPASVITDGDKSMRSAIRRVFPQSHHSLCAWHLIRNARTNIGDDRFTELFRRCMLSDYEIDRFESKWHSALDECGLFGNTWVDELYEKKERLNKQQALVVKMVDILS
ncbi:hypothetical protein RIF29_14833 [Crotalaria pallida]|uniref:MULE transposase domain-containing protein n=1 Tax=Crotalaria pallida TaxID=3830 RepID=A0AAN9FDZ9_CROPI